MGNYQGFLVNVLYDTKWKQYDDSSQLVDLWREMHNIDDGIQFQSHCIQLRTYHNCFLGKEAVDWLIKTKKVETRSQAVTVGQSLVDANLLKGITMNVFMDEDLLYQPRKAPPREITIESASPMESLAFLNGPEHEDFLKKMANNDYEEFQRSWVNYAEKEECDAQNQR